MFRVTQPYLSLLVKPRPLAFQNAQNYIFFKKKYVPTLPTFLDPLPETHLLCFPPSRSGNILFFLGRPFRSRYKHVEIHTVLGCVFNFMMCLKVIYTGLIKTEIGNWNSDGYFHRACAICEKSWWKVPEKSG